MAATNCNCPETARRVRGRLVGRPTDGRGPARPARGWPAFPAHRWLLLAGIALASLNLRFAVTSIAPLLGQVRADVGLTVLDTNLLAAAPPLVFAVCGLATMVVARRIGLEQSLIVSLALAFAGTFGRSFTQEPASFLGWTTVVMAGLGMGNVLIAPLIKRHFPGRIALVTTVYSVCIVSGQALPPVFILPMASAFGWRTATALWAVVAVLAAAPWLATMRRWRTKPAAAAEPDEPARTPMWWLWRSPVTWGISAMLASNSMPTFSLMAWLPQLLIDAGDTAEAAAGYLAVFMIGSLFGAFVLPQLVSRVRDPIAITVAMPPLWSGGLLGLALWPTTGTLVWIALTRLGDGTFAAAMTLMNLRARRPETVAALSSMAQSTSFLCAAALSFGFGELHAATGSWATPLILSACLTLAFGVTGALLTARPRMVEDAFPAA